MDKKIKEEDAGDSNAEFIDDAFDGVTTEVDRSCEVASLPDFGFPANISEFTSTRTADEFESVGEDLTRNIAALEFAPMDPTSDVFDSSNVEFEVGASFQPSQQMFASPPSPLSSKQSSNIAPIFPFYLKAVATSFRSTKNLTELQSHLENAFAECSITFSKVETTCGYSCSVLCPQLSLVQIETKIYSCDGELLVEFHRMDGCRHGFGAVSTLLATALNVTFLITKNPNSNLTRALPLPLLLDDSLLDSLGSDSLEPLDFGMPSSLSRSVDHEVDMLSEGSTREANIQGARATASLAMLPELGSLEDDEGLGPMPCFFGKGGDAIPLAHRVSELAKSSEDEEVRSVAMAAVANIASLQHVCGQWLDGAIPTLVAGAQDDCHPHVRREALRAIHSISTNDKNLAAKLVRAGVVPTLELEANGGEEDQSPDNAMQAFAQSALTACRA